MDWFERLTGFREEDYATTQSRLRVEGDELVSVVNGSRYGIGELTMPTLGELRTRVDPARGERSSLSVLVGDVRQLHTDPAYEGALFQVASQFNLLEMVSERITPEHGVARYAGDPTQGPACAISAGAGTIYRNYLVPVGDGVGQTRDRQLDALAGVGAGLVEHLGVPVESLWRMQNGYALCTPEGLAAISALLDGAPEELLDGLRRRLAIGLHRDVQVTTVESGPRRLVSQAYCSALPVDYGAGPRVHWEPFGRLVLQASYEATLLAAAEPWIDDAIDRAFGIVAGAGLEVFVVCHGHVPPGVAALVGRWR